MVFSPKFSDIKINTNYMLNINNNLLSLLITIL